MSSFTIIPSSPSDSIITESDYILINQLFAQEYGEIDFMKKYTIEALLYENITLSLNYDMGRYIDLAFIKARPFYSSSAVNFNDFLRDIVNELGALNKLNEYESHMAFLCGYFHKQYTLLLTPDLLNTFDFYIIEWANQNVSLEDYNLYKNWTIGSPNGDYINT